MGKGRQVEKELLWPEAVPKTMGDFVGAFSLFQIMMANAAAVSFVTVDIQLDKDKDVIDMKEVEIDGQKIFVPAFDSLAKRD